jgi:hypothetical protein
MKNRDKNLEREYGEALLAGIVFVMVMIALFLLLALLSPQTPPAL